MSDKNDGGPAFPTEGFVKHKGMTLRDWFAGQYLVAFAGTSYDMTSEEVAQSCYRMADAMLEERSK